MTPLPREQFAVTGKGAYFDTAAVGPTPQCVIDAVHTSLQAFGITGSGALPEHFHRLGEVRGDVEALMGAEAGTVSFTSSTTSGLATIAGGLPSAGAVAVAAGQFPAMGLPFYARGRHDVRPIHTRTPGTPDLEDYRTAVTSGDAPMLVVAPWVDANYQVIDVPALATICHNAGAMLCLDMMRGAGVLPARLRAWDVDFAVTNSYKWLLAPPGAALLYVSPARRQQLSPATLNWLSAQLDEDAQVHLAPGPEQFEAGTPAILDIVALGAAVGLLRRAEPEVTWRHVQSLRDELANGLSHLGLAPAEYEGVGVSGGPALKIPLSNPRKAASWLAASGISCGATSSELLVSLHGFNNSEDCSMLLHLLELTPIGSTQ